MEAINIYQAKTRLSELVQRASTGEEIIISRNGEPVARLVPLHPVVARQPGRWAGQIHHAPNADEAVAALLLGGE